MPILQFPKFNKLKVAGYLGVPLALGATIGVLLLRADADAMKSEPQKNADHSLFKAGVIEEMRGRMANDQDPLDVSRFKIGTSYAHIGASSTEARLTEARGLVDLEFKVALGKAGLQEGEHPEFEAGWRCATWLLDGPKGNTAGGLLEPTRVAYNTGRFAAAAERCAGAEANLIAQNGRPDGNFHYLYGASYDWKSPAPSAPPIPEGPGPTTVPTIVLHR